MSTPRVVGTTWENRCRDYLNVNGLNVVREAFSSPLGDLKGWPGVVECKGGKQFTLARWVLQAKKSLSKTAWKVFVILARKPNCAVAEGYFVTTIANGARLMRAYEYVYKNCPEVIEDVETASA